ncbi:hypothetical protein J1N35_020780 [Gossypium stocksii]|uniref:Reverse transcriptase n=1 Tax=Gossypium stocksii TaxID=47602 RepID=A0A9D3VFI5_9ROSI|nr:hypothetical protein J1N35_020780 [Gossypium stocksii]
MEAFQTVLEDCNLMDMGFSGKWFIWERDYQIQHLSHLFSDHCPLLINIICEDKRRIERRFRFEAWWVMEDSFLGEVKSIWDNSSGDLLNKLECIKRGLQKWVAGIRYSRNVKKEMLNLKLTKLLEEERSDVNLAKLIDIRVELNFEIEKDELPHKGGGRIVSASYNMTMEEKLNSNTKEMDKRVITKVLGVRCSTDPERYLGLPNLVERKRKGWRLITYPNSLLASVLKAKYYPSIDFLNARLGNLPSLTWKSIWSARGVLEKGLCWRIGKGDHISIWADFWILGYEEEKLQHHRGHI